MNTTGKRAVAWLRKQGAIVGHAICRQWHLIAVALAVIGAAWFLQSSHRMAELAVAIDVPSTKSFQDVWSRIDPIVTVATLATAVLVWLAEARQDWERGLKVQLTAEFRVGERVAMCCERALLMEESPRAWGQQLGFQMNGGKKLDISPNLSTEGGRIERWRGEWVRHLTVRFELRQWPQDVPEDGAPRVWNVDNGFGQNTATEPSEA